MLIDGQRIAAISEPAEALSRQDVRVVDAAGATLMPGLVESHGHLPFPANLSYFTQLEDTPIEELVLATVHNARLMLDHGFTAVIGAGSPRLRVELVVRKRNQRRSNSRTSTTCLNADTDRDRRPERHRAAASGTQSLCDGD